MLHGKNWYCTEISGGNTIAFDSSKFDAENLQCSNKVWRNDRKDTYAVKIKNTKNTEEEDKIKIKIYKRTNDDKELKGASFQVTYKQSGTITKDDILDMSETSAKATGYFQPKNTNDVTVTIKENTVPNGYNGAGKITITFKWQNKRWEPTIVGGGASLLDFNADSDYTFYPNGQRKIRTEDNKLFEIKIKNELKYDPIKIGVYKRTENDKALKGASFKVTYKQSGTITKDDILDMSETSAKATEYFQPTNDNNVTVTIEEDTVPDGYNGAGKITITFKWQNKRWEPTIVGGGEFLLDFNADSDYTFYPNGQRKIRTKNNQLFQIKVKNTEKTKAKFNIKKTDADGNPLKGVKFTVFLTNINEVQVRNTKINLEEIIYNQSFDEEGVINTGDNFKLRLQPKGSAFYDDRIWIEGITTDDDGLIKFTNIDSKNHYVNITVREVEPIKGFAKWPKDADTNQRDATFILWADNADSEYKYKLYNRKVNGTSPYETGILAGPKGYTYAKYNNKLPQKYWDLTNTDTPTIILKNFRVLLDLQIKKKDDRENALEGATFTAKYYQKKDDGTYPETYFKEITKSSNSEGLIDFGKIKPQNANDIKVVIEESGRPNLFRGMDGTAIIEFRYSDENEAWENISGPNNSAASNLVVSTREIESGDKITTATIDVENTPTVGNFTIIKEDMAGDKIADIGFEISLDNVDSAIVDGKEIKSSSGKITINGLKTNTEGKIVISEIIQQKDATVINVKIKEESGKAGFVLLPKTLSLKLVYDKTTGEWKLNPSEQNKLEKKYWNLYPNGNKVAVTVKNDSKIDKLKIVKTNSQDKEPVNGAKFRILTENIREVKGQSNPKELIQSTTDGNLVFEDLVIDDITKDIILVVYEDEPAKYYKKLQGPITIILKRKGDGYTKTEIGPDDKILSTEFIADKDFTLENHVITMNIKNIPIMQMGGKVWLDGQTAIKPALTPNDHIDENELRVKNVEVELYDKDGKKIDNDVYGNTLAKATDENGEYLFSNIERGEGYKIKFSYDGVKYERPVSPVNESKATEVGREEFNTKFNTINKGQTSTEITLEYNVTDNKSLLISSEGQGIKNADGKEFLDMGQVKTDFKISAESGKYMQRPSDWQDSWENAGSEIRNINLGIVRRGLDLSLKKDLVKAHVDINGKSKDYLYEDQNQTATIKIGDANFGEEITNEKYELDLPEADYNFRLQDYFIANYDKLKYPSTTDDELSKINDQKGIVNGMNSNESLQNLELQVDVTYKIYLNNQGIQDGYVNSITDYFDTNYEFNGAQYVRYAENGETEIADINLKTNIAEGTITIDGKEYNKMDIEFNTTGGNRQDKIKSGEANILYLNFKIKKVGTNREIPLGEYGNIAEIKSYSSDQGLIDVDSAPGNAIEDNQFKYEDDSDRAPALDVKVIETKRTIEGAVWEDEDKNGKKDDNKPINDVIVQLVELKQINLEGNVYNLEYVWQEMQSGTGKRLRVRTNKDVNAERAILAEDSIDTPDGGFKFEKFIPGNYIVRFIYGDGTIKDFLIDASSGQFTEINKQLNNVITYNGQDYKSTIDNAYEEELYNASNYGGTNTESIARDNEQRRLQVMSYSVDVDSEKGMLLKLLNETDDNINLDDYTETEKAIFADILHCDVTSLTSDMLREKLKEVLKSTFMYADTSLIQVQVDGNPEESKEEPSKGNFTEIIYSNMDFGLTKRPTNKLILEKHVTGLQVQVNSKDIANATIERPEGLVGRDTGPINLKGTRKGLTAFNTSRNARGFWRLETDIEELLQGATINVEYTYLVRQTGEEDYLSGELANMYMTGASYGENTNYINKLRELAAAPNPEPIGTYLSPTYYKGDTNLGNLTSSRVETVEDYYEHIDDNTTNKTKDLIFTESDSSEFKEVKVDASDSKLDTEDKLTALKTRKAYVLNNSGSETIVNDFRFNKVVRNEVPFENLQLRDINSSTKSKTLQTSKVLSAENKDNNLNFVSYTAQIIEYSSATGRRDSTSTPGNLDYAYMDKNVADSTLAKKNEDDEFWAEDVTITKPTGEDKTSMTTIIIIATSSLATLVVAIILIKKFIIGKTPKQ